MARGKMLEGGTRLRSVGGAGRRFRFWLTKKKTVTEKRGFASHDFPRNSCRLHMRFTQAGETHSMKFKFILPALTEATSPFFRPIKYSLFPPLGLATLASHLSADDEAELVDEHV